jgi:hypothetical protein
MPLNIPENHYQVSFIHNLVGSLQEAVCTLGLRYEGTTFGPNATDVELAWIGDVMGQMNNSWRLSRVVWRVQLGAVRDIPADTVGTNAAPGEPPMVAVLVRKNTGQPGRSNRGRMYLPGISEDGIDHLGMLTEVYRTGWQGVINSFHSAVLAADFVPCLFHNVDTFPAAPSELPTDIANFSVEPRVATQRRRNR